MCPVPETIKIINDIVAGLDGAENIPIYDTTPLSENEELQLLNFVYQLGPNFNRIGKIMGNRSPAALKNLYSSKLRKKKVFLSFV